MQNKLRLNSMHSDLSWFSFYGFGLMTGIISGRYFKIIKPYGTNKSIVQDVYTQRKFIRNNFDDYLVQYFDEDQK